MVSGEKAKVRPLPYDCAAKMGIARPMFGSGSTEVANPVAAGFSRSM